MPPPLFSELTARVAGEGDGGGPSVLRKECTPLPWIEAKRSVRPGSDDVGAPVTLAFPSGGEAAAEVKAVARCYFVEVQVGAMQAEGQVFQAAVEVEVHLADQWEVEVEVAEEAVVWMCN